MRNKEIIFLTLAEVISIHENQIELYGGESGIRDLTLLSSALAVPQATFDVKYLHGDIFDMAAAYCYHICQNHPFIDGNKRVALVSALVFLDINGIDIKYSEDILFKMMVSISKGIFQKNFSGFHYQLQFHY